MSSQRTYRRAESRVAVRRSWRPRTVARVLLRTGAFVAAMLAFTAKSERIKSAERRALTLRNQHRYLRCILSSRLLHKPRLDPLRSRRSGQGPNLENLHVGYRWPGLTPRMASLFTTQFGTRGRRNDVDLCFERPGKPGQTVIRNRLPNSGAGDMEATHRPYPGIAVEGSHANVDGLWVVRMLSEHR
jgi:hypothetical protein